MPNKQLDVAAAEKVPLLEQRLNSLEDDVQELKSTVDKGFAGLRSFIEQRTTSGVEARRNIWSTVVPVTSTVVIFVIGSVGTILWLIMQLNVQNITGPLGRDIVNLDSRLRTIEDQVTRNTRIIEADASSIKQMNIDHERLGQDLRDLSRAHTALDGKFVASEADRRATETEIETQFNAQSQISSLQFSNQQRTNATMWNANSDKLGSYPAGPYFYPNISRPGGVPLNNQP